MNSKIQECGTLVSKNRPPRLFVFEVTSLFRDTYTIKSHTLWRIYMSKRITEKTTKSKGGSRGNVNPNFSSGKLCQIRYISTITREWVKLYLVLLEILKPSYFYKV